MSERVRTGARSPAFWLLAVSLGVGGVGLAGAGPAVASRPTTLDPTVSRYEFERVANHVDRIYVFLMANLLGTGGLYWANRRRG